MSVPGGVWRTAFSIRLRMASRMAGASPTMRAAPFIVIAVGLGKVFGATRMLDDITGLTAMLGISAGILVLGLGVFFSSRFAEPPPGCRLEPRHARWKAVSRSPTCERRPILW